MSILWFFVVYKKRAKNLILARFIVFLRENPEIFSFRDESQSIQNSFLKKLPLIKYQKTKTKFSDKLFFDINN